MGFEESDLGLMAERVDPASRAPVASLNWSVHRADAVTGRDVAAIAPAGCDVLVWPLPPGTADILTGSIEARRALRCALSSALRGVVEVAA